MAKIKLLVIGGSAGSLDVLFYALPRLNSLTFPVIVVLHRKKSDELSFLSILAKKATLPVLEIEAGLQLLSGAIYLAPAGYHLLFESDGSVSLDVSERIRFNQPSIDLAFETAADAYGSSVAGLLVSGANSDGVKGLGYIKEKGGYTAVQSPHTAEMPYMPEQAIATFGIDAIVDHNEIPSFINNLCKT